MSIMKPLMRVLVAADKDPHWDKVVALLHFDGADGSTTIVDEAGSNWNVRGGAHLSTAQSVFGGTSLSCPTGGGIYRATEQIGERDFCLEFWIWPRATGQNFGRFVEFGPRSVGNLVFNNAGAAWPPRMMAQQNNYGVNIHSVEVQLVASTWQHIALTRESNTYRIFVDGVKKSERYVTNGSNLNNSSPVNINTSNSGGESFNAYYDEFRLTYGVARYTDNFTRPNRPFPNK